MFGGRWFPRFVRVRASIFLIFDVQDACDITGRVHQTLLRVEMDWLVPHSLNHDMVDDIILNRFNFWNLSLSKTFILKTDEKKTFVSIKLISDNQVLKIYIL